jgi:hypothetical protein
MTKLISGRVAKVPSANVSADRHEFIELSETEPDLGLPTQSGWVLSSDVTGNRSWVDPVQAAGGIPYFANTALVANVAFTANSANIALVALVANVALLANVANTVLSIANFTTTNLKEGSNLYYTDYRVLSNVSLMSVNVFADVDITGIVPNGILTWDGTKFIAGTIATGAVANTALFSYIANIANTVSTLSNFTTANLIESSSNLYFTNSRVVAALTAGQNITIEANGRISANASSALSSSSSDSLPEGTNNLYYTNSRVISAVTPLLTAANIANFTSTVNATIYPSLTTANVVEVNSNLYFTYARANATIWPSLTAANIANFNTTVNAIIYPSLTTANVVEVGSNLYFTYARANATLWPSLTTANVVETSGNLYFTNARANAAIYPSLTAANIANFNSTVNTIVQPFLTAANIANFASTVNTIVQPFLTAANIANFASTVNTIVRPMLTTANVIETSANLYFTNARVVAGLVGSNINVYQVTANIGIFGSGVGGSITGANLISSEYLQANTWLGLYTANVVETAGNLYFTNSRVVSALIAGNNITIEANGRISANTSGIASGLGLTTADVQEVSSNLYFTYARANATIWPSLTAANIANFTSTVNATVYPSLTTANVVELTNQYFTNVRVLQVVNPLLTTANVTELTNLYFTNARARTAITGGTGVVVDWSTGSVSIGQNVATTASVTFYNLNVTNNLTVYGGIETFSANNMVVSDNMIYLNSGSINSNPDLGIAFNYNDGIYHHAGFFRDHSDGVFKVFDNYSPEPDANIFINTAHASFRIANIQATTLIGNITGTAGTLDNFTTTNLKEGSNLYYTNARARTAFTAGSGIIIDWAAGTITANAAGVISGLTTADVLEASSNLYFTYARANAAIYPSLTTANVVELTNLYFTNVRVLQAVTPLLTTANVIESSGNLYFTPARVNATIQPFLTTANVVETASNLYFTYARANATIWPSLTAANIANFTSTVNATVYPSLTAANIANFNSTVNATIYPSLTAANIANFASTVNATIWPSLTTANVIETRGNLYFTNTRVVSALIAGDNITIEANGRISANSVTAGTLNLTTADVREVASNLYFTYARVNATVQPFLTTANVTESSGNLYFTYARANATIWPSLTAANIANFNSTVNAIIYPSLTTANVIETSGNLYFTYARVNATVQPFLTTANVVETSGNLYFTNTRVFNAITIGTIQGSIAVTGNLSANGLIIQGINVTSTILAGNVVSGGTTTSNVILADSITANTWNRLYTANVVETSGNLYFTNARAVAAFTAGRGIALSGAGLISVTGAPYDFNTGIDGAQGYLLTGSLVPVVRFNGGVNDRFILRSLHVTNISDSTAYITANVGYLITGNSVTLAKLIPIPAGGVLEFLKKPQVFSSNDTIGLQSFNNAILPASNVLSAIFTYETVSSDASYNGVGTTIIGANTNATVFQSSQGAAVVASIKIVNSAIVAAPVKVAWANANNVIKAYFSYNFNVPPNSSVEMLQYPKRMETNDKIIVSYPQTTDVGNTDLSCFVSYRYFA